MFGSIDINSKPLCLEFTNTVEWHASQHPEETILSYADLAAWAVNEKYISKIAAQELLREASNLPAKANRSFEQAIALREAIYRIFVALTQQKLPTESDLAMLNATLVRVTNGAHIARTGDHFAWRWNTEEGMLDPLIAPIALSAAELLISEERKHVGQCADDMGCGWLFLDTSKNHSRRWCNMNDCGNRAKQRRHNRQNRENAI